MSIGRQTRRLLGVAPPPERVPGRAEWIALVVGEYLHGRDREHHRFAVAIRIAEAATASDEFPPPVPPSGERAGNPAEHGIVAHPHRVALYHDVQPLVPAVAAGGQRHVLVGG